MLLYCDFYSKVLAELGLKKFTDVAEEIEEIDDSLIRIGALTSVIA